jgi:hypothetical protein
MVSYTLDNAAEMHRAAPATFYLPPLKDRETLRPGDLVKLVFRIEFAEEAHVERMWVIVTEAKPEFYIGVLDNDPYCTEEIRSGMRVEFHADHVIQIDRAVARPGGGLNASVGWRRPMPARGSGLNR